MVTMSDTDWVVAGAEVLVYSFGGQSGRTNSTCTRIKKVDTKSFSVEATNEPRFSVAYQETSEGGTLGCTRRVVPIDSDEAREVLKEEHRIRVLNRARNAVNKWSSAPRDFNRLAAIKALQEVED